MRVTRVLVTCRGMMRACVTFELCVRNVCSVVCCSVLQCIAVYYSVLQFGAFRCSVMHTCILPSVACAVDWCSVVQCVAVCCMCCMCCSVLQCVAV